MSVRSGRCSRPVHDAPRAIIAHTVKGKGLSFAAGVAAWHDHGLDRELWDEAEVELAAAREAASP
jgi:transketolase